VHWPQLRLADAPSRPASARRSNREARNGHWLCADPVHLRFHHERIILADAGAFDLETTRRRALTTSLNQEFADIGQFHVATARRWYLKPNAAVDHPAPAFAASPAVASMAS
jgi:hypothetical protein